MSVVRGAPARTRLRISEDQFLHEVLDLAHILGWKTLHIRPARTADSWRTPVQGDGIGFPDVLLLRGPRLVVAELKSAVGVLTDSQTLWLAAWDAIPGAEVHVWRPENLPEVQRVLAVEKAVD